MRENVVGIVNITNVIPLVNRRYAHIEFIVEILDSSNPLAGVPRKFQTYTWMVWDYVDRKLKFSAELKLGLDSKQKLPPKADITSLKEDTVDLVIYESINDLKSNIGMYFDAFIYNEQRPFTNKIKRYIEDNNINVEKMIIDYDI